MSAFQNITDEEIKAAQRNLEELCKNHGIEKFDIQDDVGLVCWQKLVQAMCGIDITRQNATGRKPNSDELVDEVRRLYALYIDFSRLEIFDDGSKNKETVYNQLPDFRKKQIHGFIADSLSKCCGKEITPQKIRGILNNKHNKAQLERLRAEEFKQLEESPFDPDEMPQRYK